MTDTPPNQKYADEELLDQIREFVDENGEPPTTPEWNDCEGVASVATFGDRFGSWTDALEAAGVESTNWKYSDSVLLQQLRDLRDDLGRRPVLDDIRNADGVAGWDTFRRHFGGLEDARREAFDDHPLGIDEDGPIEITRGVDLDLEFQGSPAHLRTFNYKDVFGLLVKDLDPIDAEDLLGTADVDAEVPPLATLMAQLARAGCNQSQIVDYLAIRAGIGREEWADLTNAHPETVRDNRSTAENALAELGDD